MATSKVPYDDLMYCAVSHTRHVRDPIDTGFINRITGEIVFVYGDEADAEEMGAGLGAEARLARATVEASPEQWIEIPRNELIPRYHEHWCARRVTRGKEPCNCPEKDREYEDDDAFIAR